VIKARFSLYSILKNCSKPRAMIHLALLAGTDISAAEVLMRGLVTCYVLFFIIWRALGLTFRGSQLPQQALETTSDSKRAHTGRGTRQRRYALQDRDTTSFTSFQAPRARPERSVSVGAERSMVAPANECLSKVIFFGDRSSHRMTTSHTERNHQGKPPTSLLQQIADTRCEEAGRSRERRGKPLRSYQQDAA
jgi:hypothetical protein